MWTFERDELAERAVNFCRENHMEPTPRNVLAALDSLQLLRDTIDRRGVCPYCQSNISVKPNYVLAKP